MTQHTDPTAEQVQKPSLWARFQALSRGKKILATLIALIVIGVIGANVAPTESQDESESEEVATVEDDDAEAVEEDQDAGEASEEEAEITDYTVETVEGHAGEEVSITFDLPDHFTGGLMASAAQNTAREALSEAHDEHPGMYRYVVFIQGEDGLIANSAFEPSTLEGLDLDDATLNVFEHLDAGSAHPDLLD